jgi:hypothetical protein
MMSRRKGQRTASRARSTPEEVLSGAVVPTIEELFRLVHEVNPTGAEVSPAESARRYAIKARLQSELIRRFGDQIDVVPDPTQPSVVSLQHVSGTRDACHALVAELDTDARSWVRRRLDERAAEAPRRSAAGNASPGGSRVAGPSGGTVDGRTDAAPRRDDGDALSAAELVDRARGAIAEYDYEAAQRDLQAALARPGGSHVAARPLIELLVEHLGMDEEALATASESGLDRASDPACRGLLGLAAARLGRRGEAIRLARGLPAEAASRVHVALARVALAAGDEIAAAHDLEAARRATPGGDEVEALLAELQAHRGRLRRPDEEALVAAQAAGERAEDLISRARAVLGRWPESETAKRVLRAAEARLALDRAEALFDRAGDALEAGDLVEARRLAREGQALGGGRPSLASSLDAAEAAARQRAEAEAVASVSARLLDPDGGGRREALGRYSELPGALRAQVRSRVSLPLLAWLDEAAHSGAAPSVVDAVLALEHARSAAVTDPEAALALLERHTRELRGLQQAADVRREAVAAVERRETERALATLHDAEAAAAAGRLHEAERRLEGCNRRRLPEELRRRLHDIEERIGRAGHVRALEARHAAAQASGDLFEAADVAERLAASGGTEQRERWTGELGQLRARIRSAWRVWRVEDGASEIGLNAFSVRDRDTTNQLLSDDGQRLVLAGTSEAWLSVREWDVVEGRVARATMLRPPSPLGSLVNVRLEGDELWILGETGVLVVLSVPTGDVLRSWNLLSLISEGEVRELEHAWIIPEACSIWTSFTEDEGEERIVVIDTERRRVSREWSRRMFFYPVLGERANRVLVEKGSEAPFTLCHPRGPAVADLTLPESLTGAAVAPRNRLVALLGESLPQDGPEPLSLVLVDEQGHVGQQATIAGSDSTSTHSMVSSLSCQLAFVAFGDVDLGHRLAAFSLADPLARRTFDVGVPWDTVLAGDSAGERAVAIVDDGTQVRVVALGDTWPLRSYRSSLPGQIPSHLRFLICDETPRAVEAEAQNTWEGLLDLTAERARSAVQEEADRRAGDPAALAALVVMVERHPELGVSVGDLARQSLAMHPNDPVLGYLAGRAALQERDWAGALSALKACRPSRLDKAVARHHRHLTAIACLATGAVAEAHRTIRAARNSPGLCRLESLLPLTRPPEAFADPKRWGPGRPLAWQVVGAVRTADGALARGDLSSALAALDRPAVWASGEIQSLARLAEVCLSEGTDAPAARFRRAEACARYCGAIGDAHPREMPLPGAMWPSDRLNGLALRCREHLESLAPSL